MIGNSALAKEFWENGKSDSCPIYDMHGHMGPLGSIYFPRGDTEGMIQTMDECGVKMLVFSHHLALFSPDFGNRPSIEAVRRYPNRLRAYCVINPNYPEEAEKDIAAFDDHRDVFVGFKFLSDYHKVALTDDRYTPALKFADANGLLTLMHTWGGSQYDGPKPVRQIAERYPNIKFLLGHSCHGEWDEAVKLARDFPNIYLELTAVFDDRGVIEKFASEAGSDRMLFGTDLPWFDPHHAVGVLLSSHISDDDRRNICYRNAVKLLKVPSPDEG
jgi:uncharacterized protein